MTTEIETAAPSILSAIAKAAKPAKAPKADKPAKIAKAKPAKAAKAKPTKAAKIDTTFAPAAKPAKPRKEKTVTETAPAFDLNTLLADFHASDTRDDAFILDLLQKAFDAGKAAPRARAPRAGGPSKAELAAELLRRPEGATTKDILDLTKWPAVSVPAIARSAGLTLRQEKEGRVTRYFGS